MEFFSPINELRPANNRITTEILRGEKRQISAAIDGSSYARTDPDLADGGEESVHILAGVELAEADAHGSFGKSPDDPVRCRGTMQLIEPERDDTGTGRRVAKDADATSLADHHVRGLDNRERIVTDPEAEIVDGLVGNRRGDDDSAANVDTNMCGCLTLGYCDNLALELIAGAELHEDLLSRQNPAADDRADSRRGHRQ